jgi:hypothetical protein
MWLREVREWCRVRITPLLRQYVHWPLTKRITKPIVRQERASIFQKAFNKERIPIPFAGHRLTNGMLGIFVTNRLSEYIRTQASKIAIMAGYVPSKGKSSSLGCSRVMIEFNPPMMTSELTSTKDAITLLKEHADRTLSWTIALGGLLQDIELMGAEVHMASPTCVQIETRQRQAVLDLIARQMSVLGLQVSHQESVPVYEESIVGSSSISSFSCLSLVFPHLRESELDAFSSLSQL